MNTTYLKEATIIIQLIFLFLMYKKIHGNSKKRIPIGSDLKYGKKCHCCKTEIVDDEFYIHECIDGKPNICKNCKRKENIDLIVRDGLFRVKYKNRINNFILLSKFDYYMLSLHIVAFIIIFFNYYAFAFLSCLIAYLQYYSNMLTTIKKPLN